MVAIVALLVAVSVFGDILRASIVLDLISFWPLFAVLAVATGVWFVKRSAWPDRAGAAIALLTLTAMLGVVALHLIGWGPLPSSVVVEGPNFDGGAARIDIAAEGGTVFVGSADLPLAFTAELIPRGGDLGVARASGLDSSPLSVSLVQRGDPGLHRAEGWSVTLANSGRWTVSLTAETFDVDLRDSTVADAVMVGSGSLRLDAVVPGSVISVDGGPVAIEVPTGVGIGVVGQATVPDDWAESPTGFTSPAGSGGFQIQVFDGTEVTVTQR